VGAFCNQLAPIQIKMGNNYYDANIRHQTNDHDSIVFFLDDHVY